MGYYTKNGKEYELQFVDKTRRLESVTQQFLWWNHDRLGWRLVMALWMIGKLLSYRVMKNIDAKTPICLLFRNF